MMLAVRGEASGNAYSRPTVNFCLKSFSVLCLHLATQPVLLL